MAPRTGHNAHTHTGQNPPDTPQRAGRQRTSYGDVPGTVKQQAAEEDRRYRAAYGVPAMRSPYLSAIRVPAAVAPGDCPAAAAVVERVEAALLLRGRWTKAERARLRDLRDKWARRAAGQDSNFNLLGWKARQMPQDKDRVADVFNTIRREIGD